MEATLLPCGLSQTGKQVERQAEKSEDPVAAVAADVDSPTEASSLIEHRLQLSYNLLNGEAVSSGPVVSTADPAGANAAVAAITPPLCWSATQQLAVNEALVHAAASSNAAFPVLFTSASRIVSEVPPPDAAAAASAAAAKPAKPGKAAASAAAAKPAKPGKAAAVPEEVPWQPDQQCTLPIDLAALLIGDTDLVSEWPQKGLALPPQLQAYSRIKLRVQVLLCIQQLDPG